MVKKSLSTNLCSLDYFFCTYNISNSPEDLVVYLT